MGHDTVITLLISQASQLIFNSPAEALNTYNGLGLNKKIHFKKYNIRRDDNDFISNFSLWWHKRNTQNRALGNLDENGNPIVGADCPVMAKFSWDKQKQWYIRTGTPSMKHDHKPEIKNRQLMANWTVRNEVRVLVKAGLSTANIQNIMNHKYQTVFNYGFIYGLARRVKYGTLHDTNLSDAEKMISLLEELKQADPDTDYIWEYEPDGFPKDLNKIIVMTGKMKRFYQKYHDVVFMDATYKTNKHDMALTIFSGVNWDGRNTVLGYALVKKENSDTYKWLLSNLVKLTGMEPGVILTDFDPSMWHGIERIFKNTTHMLWQWHMMCNFKRHFFFLTKKKDGASKILFQKIIDTIFTPNPKDFQELQEIIFSSQDRLDETKLDYLRKMFAIKEKWAAAFTPAIFHAGTHTISRAESVNSQVKSKVFRRSSLWDIFKLMNDILEKWIKKSVLDRTQKVHAQVVRHPLLKEIYERYSGFSFNHMLYQYMLSHSLIIKKLDDESSNNQYAGQYVVKDPDDRDKYTVEIIEPTRAHQGMRVECKCKFRTAQRMYWSHIFAVLNMLQIKTIEKLEPEDRWMDRLSNFLPEPESKLAATNKRNEEFLSRIKREKLEDFDFDDPLNFDVKKEH